MLIGANWFIAAHSMKRLMTKERFLDLRDVHLMKNLFSILIYMIASEETFFIACRVQ